MPIPSGSRTVILAALAFGCSLGASEVQPVGWDVAKLPAWISPVPHEALVVEGKTDIRWMPREFAFTPGQSVRYIDFASGDDAHDGLTRATAWKHHPWDPAAGVTAAKDAGTQTYVFKRGVVYRGQLVGTTSGTAEQPVRLTSDPAWGQGDAILAGSLGIDGGWQLASAELCASTGFPTAVHGKLWSVALPGAQIPRALWRVGKDGTRERLTLARWPDWKIEHPYNHFTQWLRVESINKGWPRTTIFAPKVLNEPDKNAYNGATVWMDHANTSGEFSIMGPFPSAAAGYDPAKGSLQILISHPRRHPAPNAPFYLENLPRFLDHEGEWWFDAKTSRLWLRLPGDADPNTSLIEAAQHNVIIDLVATQHVELTGLALTGGNCPDLNKAPGGGDWERRNPITQMGAIRLKGNCQHIVLGNLSITQTAGGGIVNDWIGDGDPLRDIEIRDSRFADIDNDGILLCQSVAESKSPHGLLNDIRVWRNYLTDIGMRCSVQQGGRGIGLQGVRKADVAGNIVERVGKQGIDVVGDSWQDVPLVRIQIRHNKVVDTLMQRQDFGGIEFWGLGPCYIFGNLSINPVGFVAHRSVYHKNEAFYVDHGLKAYLFNNLGWSERRADAHRGVMGDHFINEIRNRWNESFQNTACDFRGMQSHSMQHGDQEMFLGNLFIDGRSQFSLWRLDQAQEVAYANNLITGAYNTIYDRWKGESYRTMEEFNSRLAALPNNLSSQAGWVSDDPAVVDSAKRDFRLTDTSAAIDRGVKVFVPWALAGTVGEWQFRLHPRDPATVLGYDLYTQPFDDGTGAFQLPMAEEGKPSTGRKPGNELIAAGFTAADYLDGPLEDWVRGAVRLDGTRTLSIPHERLVRDFTITRAKEEVVIPGADRKTVQMQDNSFLVEAVLRAEAGKPGLIAGQQDGKTGYALALDAQGHVAMRILHQGATAVASTTSAISDGRWHHVLAEVDRVAGTMRIFVDGIEAGSLTSGLPPAGASLANGADFVVGQGVQGALDYLRVARGTLADSGTSIGELMAWQFNGPALHDFVGRAPTGGVRDIGAIEHPTISGRKPIRYTPPPPPTPEPGQANMIDGRLQIAMPWGSVNVPKKPTAAGGKIEIQVTFGTEAIEKGSSLGVDLIGWHGDDRLGVVAESPRQAVTPGTTTPYTVTLTMPTRTDMTSTTALVFASPDGTAAGAKLKIELTIPFAKP